MAAMAATIDGLLVAPLQAFIEDHGGPGELEAVRLADDLAGAAFRLARAFDAGSAALPEIAVLERKWLRWVVAYRDHTAPAMSKKDENAAVFEELIIEHMRRAGTYNPAESWSKNLNRGERQLPDVLADGVAEAVAAKFGRSSDAVKMVMSRRREDPKAARQAGQQTQMQSVWWPRGGG